MKFTALIPSIRREMTRERARFEKNMRRAAIIATDRAANLSRSALQKKMAAMRLGRLGNAIGVTSTKRRPSAGDPYGVIFARGGDNSRAGGALEAYSRGATIEPINGNQWLWIATPAIPKKVGRRRMTPALFRTSSNVGSIGKLEFRPIGPDRALLVIKRVSVSPKTGRAKALGTGKTRTRIPMKEVVAFIGIRITTRAQRFDKDAIAAGFARSVPGFMQQALEQLARDDRS